MRLNIRCCCTPTKILGSMIWPELPDGSPQRRWVLAYKESITAPLTHITLEARTFQDYDGRREVAVFGDDRPIEFWQRVRGYLPPQP